MKYQCHKNDQESFTAFIQKLDGKKPTVRLQKQAVHAVNIYYELAEENAKIATEAKNKILPAASNPWADAYVCLKNEILVRHYSKRTFVTYSKLVKNFQQSANSKKLTGAVA